MQGARQAMLDGRDLPVQAWIMARFTNDQVPMRPLTENALSWASVIDCTQQCHVFCMSDCKLSGPLNCFIAFSTEAADEMMGMAILAFEAHR